jgi:hypothetical protein
MDSGSPQAEVKEQAADNDSQNGIFGKNCDGSRR